MAEPGAPAPWTRRRVATLTALTLALLGAVWIAAHTGGTPFVLFAGLVVGTALRPVVEAVCGCRLPRWAAALVVFAALGAVLTAALVFVAPLLAEQVHTVAERLPGYYRSVREQLRQSDSALIRQIGAQLPGSMAQTGRGSRAIASAVQQGVELLTIVPGVLLGITGVLVVAFSWCIDRPVLMRVVCLLPRSDRREHVRAFVEAAEERVGAYVRGQVIVCVLVGLLAAGAYALLGLPYALLLGVAAAAMEIVPFVGPVLGAAPAFAVALSISPTLAIWVIAAAGAIQAIENYLLAPRVLGRSVGVSAFALILAVVAFTSLFGAPGAILGVPMAAVLQLALERFVLAPTLAAPSQPEGRDQQSALAYEARQVAVAARRLAVERGLPATSDEARLAEEIEALADGLVCGLETAEEAPPA